MNLDDPDRDAIILTERFGMAMSRHRRTTGATSAAAT